MDQLKNLLCRLIETIGIGKLIHRMISDASLKAVLTLRALMIKFIFMVLGILLIFAGLTIIPLSLALYAPWDTAFKMTVLLYFGLGYLVTGIFVTYRMLRQPEWEKLLK